MNGLENFDSHIKTHHPYISIYILDTHLYSTALTNFIRSYEYVDGIKNRQNNNGIRMNGKNERHNLLTAKKKKKFINKCTKTPNMN